MKFDVPILDLKKEICNYSHVSDFLILLRILLVPHLRNVISMCSSFLKVRILISRARTSFYGGATSTFSRSEFSFLEVRIFYLQANSIWG